MSDTDLPAIGEPAPPFALESSGGKPGYLEAYRDMQYVLLAFYVLDFTGG